MAWFNRKTVIWSEQELKWIEENAKSVNSQNTASMAKWFNADVLVD